MNTILILSLAAMVIGVALIFWGRSRSRLLGDIQGLETSTVDGLMEGRYVELKGRADCENPVKEPSGGRPYVYYRYKIEEKRRRRTSKGDYNYTWQTVDTGDAQAPFKLTDETGSVAVNARGADFDAPEIV